ncbi:META domain-containing protein [Neolewinella antarctica]|uniref:Heat shock protein HslJ n=1 Tax=Neolewinella antarctica TaxID=442734 RepID=A0ABX0XCY1_9BACT|nr:META domain-containing protein [Neolewinella antarctica]NJC26779.1 heat shock protein HslJ [Neolewinella antarctica]
MKKLLSLCPLLLLAIMINSCSSAPKPGDQNQGEANYRIHDIWVLKTLAGESISVPSGNLPSLEINLTREEMLGSDGCNELSAPISSVSDAKIVFGPIRSTRMACPDQDLASRYTMALSEVRTYALQELNLMLYDGDGKELMKLLKVD